MNVLPLPLAEFQSWMQAVLVHPDGAGAGLNVPEARRFVAPEEASGVVRERARPGDHLPEFLTGWGSPRRRGLPS